MSSLLPRFVLVRTSHPGNIGSTARAMRTMGYDDLQLVKPAHFPDPQADIMAVGAPGVLEHAGVHDEMQAALHDCQLIFGLSARRRGISLPEYTPRMAAEKAWQAMHKGEQVAMVFGNESSGLDNLELMHCHAMVKIPSVADFSSLNLAQAVQVMAYELHMAELDNMHELAPQPLAESADLPADGSDMEQFFKHLAQTLETIDFHKGRSPDTVMLRLRKLFQRARPDRRELRILHGILADAEHVARRTKTD